MYRRVLLAYDGTLEGRIALREGARLAKACSAKVYLLSIVPLDGVLVAEAMHAGPVSLETERYNEVLNEGVAKLTGLGLTPIARLVKGDARHAIAAFAEEIDADLVVVGHRRQSFAERWWSGPSGGYLVDRIRCSLLIARSPLDEASSTSIADNLPFS